MGLIKKNYEIPELGITLDFVYAKIVVISSEYDGKSVAHLQIRKTREDFDTRENQPIKQIGIQFNADKNIPLWKQAYEEAKKTDFIDWEDAFVEREI